jgi:hypothetical protein
LAPFTVINFSAATLLRSAGTAKLKSINYVLVSSNLSFSYLAIYKIEASSSISFLAASNLSLAALIKP